MVGPNVRASNGGYFLLLVLSLILSACQSGANSGTTQAKLEWPLAFQGPPLDSKVTVRGLTPGNPTDDPKWVETFGDPIAGLPGSEVTFEGPVLVECHGTGSSVNCIFSNEIEVDEETLKKGEAREKVESLLGPAQAENARSIHYRLKGNVRLGVWFEKHSASTIDFFTYYSGGSGRQVNGWGGPVRNSAFDISP